MLAVRLALMGSMRRGAGRSTVISPCSTGPGLHYNRITARPAGDQGRRPQGPQTRSYTPVSTGSDSTTSGEGAMVSYRVGTRRWAFVVLAFLVLGGASPAQLSTPVTIVAIPWGTATIDGGDPFVVPATIGLEPGEYRLHVERRGFHPVDRTIRVDGGAPQNHLVRLERR
jgi:hypothetical protein